MREQLKLYIEYLNTLINHRNKDLYREEIYIVEVIPMLETIIKLDEEKEAEVEAVNKIAQATKKATNE